MVLVLHLRGYQRQRIAPAICPIGPLLPGIVRRPHIPLRETYEATGSRSRE